jgi:hypothetical protein
MEVKREAYYEQRDRRQVNVQPGHLILLNEGPRGSTAPPAILSPSKMRKQHHDPGTPAAQRSDGAT